MYGGSSTYIPLKVNMAGVIPVIFASSLLALPALVAQFGTPRDGSAPPEWVVWIQANLTRGDHWIYMAIYVALILFFTFFYVSITFNPVEVADNMKRYGGFIPGIRAGRPTDHLPALSPDTVVYTSGAPAMTESVGRIARAAGARCYADPFVPATTPSDQARVRWAMG
jgi:preprotein translocase subunit SecY